MPKIKPIKAALIGSGAISGIYLKNLVNTFNIVDLVACSDIIPERAEKRAEEYGIKVMTNDEIFADKSIEIVINTTFPKAHYEVTKAALMAGKHVYCEKMMSTNLESAKELYDLAKSKNLYYTMAPDTFLGSGLQTARFIIDSGLIGEVIGISGFCQRNYSLQGQTTDIPMILDEGGGIPFDMGGYYLHAFMSLVGTINRVTGFAKGQKDYTYINPRNEKYGETIEFNSIDTINAAIEFENGVYGNLLISSRSIFAAQKIEVMGTQGLLCIHDPNNFSGPITVKRVSNNEDLVFPYTHPYTDNTRGIGVADMAYAIRNGRKARADAIMGLSAIETITKVWESTTTGKTYTIENKAERPKAFKASAYFGDVAESMLDD